MHKTLFGGALLILAAASCTPSATIPCASSNQCPAGDLCSAEGVCEASADTLPEGFVEVIAGGAIGDHGPAEESILRGVDGIAVDEDGTIYIGEASQGRIRRIAPDGIITTIAGNGVRGATTNTPIGALSAQVSPGDLALKNGYLYFTDTEGDRVVRMDLASGLLELVGTASFSTPRGIAVDDLGNVYVGDYAAYRVRRIDAVSGNVSTFAGDGISGSDGDGGPATAASVYGPWGVALSADYLYVSTYYGDRVRRINLSTGIISAYAGTGSESFSGDGGPATSAAVNSPRHLAFDSAGNLLIADYGNGRIRKVDAASGTISTVAGGTECCFIAENSPADQTYLPQPSGFAVGSDDTIYIGDGRNHLLRKVSLDGNIKTIAGGVSPDGDLGANARINSPYGVAPDHKGGVIIADREASRVLRLDLKSGVVSLIAGTGHKGFSGDGSSGAEALINSPSDVVVDEAGNIYIADQYNSRVRKVDTDGVISTFAGGGNSDADGGPANMTELREVRALALDAENQLYIAEGDRIRMVNSNGIITTFAGTGVEGTSGDGGPAIDAEFYDPAGMVFDTDGNLYVSESSGHVVRQIDTAGNISTIAGSGVSGRCGDGLRANEGCLSYPQKLAISEGGLYVADLGNHRIRRVDMTTRTLTSVTSGGCCLSSPREEARNAKLYNPTGLATLPDDSLVLTEQSNGLIRRLSE